MFADSPSTSENTQNLQKENNLRQNREKYEMRKQFEPSILIQ